MVFGDINSSIPVHSARNLPGLCGPVRASDLARKIEHQMRLTYSIPPEVKMKVGDITPSSEVPGYDSISVNIDGGDGKAKDYKFLLSKDRNTMLRVTKFDLTKDPYQDVMGKIDVTGRPSRGAKACEGRGCEFRRL